MQEHESEQEEIMQTNKSYLTEDVTDWLTNTAKQIDQSINHFVNHIIN